jgi:hypothetical protein
MISVCLRCLFPSICLFPFVLYSLGSVRGDPFLLHSGARPLLYRQASQETIHKRVLREKLSGTVQGRLSERRSGTKQGHKANAQRCAGSQQLLKINLASWSLLLGYPDMGNGIYSHKLSVKDWIDFNSAQRAHLVRWIPAKLKGSCTDSV